MANERLGLSDEEAIAYPFALLQLAALITLFALMSKYAKYAKRPRSHGLPTQFDHHYSS